MRWQVPLGPPVTGLPAGLQVSPVAVGEVAVFAHGGVSAQAGDVLYGLRLADGHRLWSRATSQPIAGMWRWRHLVAVLTAGSGQQHSVLTGLEASTGRTRWTLPMDGGAFSQTADGGLVMTVDRDGVSELEVVDLSSGRVRWTRPVDSDTVPPVPPVAVRGGAVLFVGGADGDPDGSLTSYDDRTGQVRWTEALKPASYTQPPLQVSAGLVYLAADLPAGGQTAGQPAQSEWVLLGISATDGRVRWRYNPPGSLDVYASGLMSVITSAYPAGRSLDELDPAAGRVRWHVVSPDQAMATTPAGIVVTAPGPESGPAAGTYQIGVRHTLTGRIRWTVELNEPLAAEPGQTYEAPPALPVFQAGRLLVAPTASPDDTELLAALRISNGHRAWQVTLPGPVEAPLSSARGGMLVYAGG